MRRERDWRPVWISILYWAAVLGLRPFADIPLNDDWAYAASVRSILAEGRLRLSDWATPTLAVQAFWGALFAKAFGTGYGPLRLSTLVLAWLGGLSFFRFLKRSVLAPGLEAPLTLALLFNPLFFVLSPGFLTDVPALALCLIALELTWRGQEASGGRWLLAAGAMAALACGVRQTAILFPVGAALWLAWNRRLSVSRLACILGPSLASWVGYAAWWRWVHGPTANAYGFLWQDAHLGWQAVPGLRLSAGLLYAGLAALPVSVAIWIPARRGVTAGSEGLPRLLAMAAGAALAAFLLGGGWLPYRHASVEGVLGRIFTECNYLSLGGLGCFDMEGAADRGLPIFSSAAWWRALSVAGLASVVTLFLASAAGTAPAASLAAVCLAPQILPLLVGAEFFDRYFLPLVPAALAVSAAALGKVSPGGAPGGRLGIASLWAAALVSAAVSWAGTADYLRASEAAWRLGHAGIASGFPREKVKAGLTWCWHAEYPRRMEEAKRLAGLEARVIARDLDCLSQPLAVVSFRSPSRVNRPVLASESYWSPLGLRRETLTLYDLR